MVGQRVAVDDPGLTAPGAGALQHLIDLSVRLATLTDLEAVLESVADCAMAVFTPAACALDLLNDAGSVVASVTRGLDEAAQADWQRLASQVARPTQPTPMEMAWPTARPAGGAGPLVAVRAPLALPNQPAVGTLTLFYDRLGPDDCAPELLRPLVLLAASAAMSSAVRLRDVQAVHTVAQTITGRIDLAQLAHAALGAIAGQFEATGGVIVLAEGTGPAGGTLQVVAEFGMSAAARLGANLLDWHAQRPSPAILGDLESPPLERGLRGIGLSAPLLLERKLLGVLAVSFDRPILFRQGDLWLLSALASQVTLALRNAQLYLWSEELAIAEERGRIAREIHDGLAQSLAHKVIKIELCQRLIGRDEQRLRQELEAIKASVRADIQDVRHSILALRPLDLEHRGLADAVHGYIRQFSHDTGIACEPRLDGLETVPPKLQTALFRLVQEALNNIRKHAGAGACEVEVRVDGEGEIYLRVGDNGRGFDVHEALRRPPGQTGIGLKGMVERTVAAGGTIEIDSEPGQGTRIEIHLPAR